MKRVKTLAVANSVFYVIAFAISILSQSGIIGRQDMAMVSAKYDTVFTPAGLTFSVWSLIYTALFAFCIYHLMKAFKEDVKHEANQSLLKIGWLFCLNNIATAAWVIFWLNEYLLVSVWLMLTQLTTLIVINSRLAIFNPDKSLANKIYTQFPLSIYFAWICIATIANISAALVGFNWQGEPVSPIYWTIILIGIATLITLYMVLIRRNVFFGLIVIWALYGIVLKRTDVDPTLYSAVINAAWTAIAIIFLVEIIQLIKLIKVRQNPEISVRHNR